MTIRNLFTLLFISWLGLSCQAQNNQSVNFKQTRIVWDTWGVPHIYAKNDQDLFMAMGWAHMHNHGNLILKMYGKSRGKAAEYWGVRYLHNDKLIRSLQFPQLAKKWQKKQHPTQKKYIEAFVKGMNKYAQAHPNHFDKKYKVVLPVTTDDIHLHLMYVVFTRFVGGSELGRVQKWADKGSNAYAIAPSRSASKNAMLVQNPHLPWSNEFLFHEMHLISPRHNTYGVNLVGLPGIAIGFNQHLGWSHTDNTIDNADTYELELKDEGYVMDGAVKPFVKTRTTIQVKTKEGKFQNKTIDLLVSEHGPVVKMGKHRALAIKMAGTNAPNMALQWWKMATAKNLRQFEKALKMQQIPFWNVMYADKKGNIFYMFNGRVPVRSKGDWGFWNNVVPGNTTATLWHKIHAYKEMPQLKNPPQGWLQNANDPPWSVTFPPLLIPKNYPPYMAPIRMGFRPQRSARMLAEDTSITFDELVAYKHSTRSELADRILDDLFAAVDQYGNALSQEAKKVLQNWNRHLDNDSKGAYLFYAWASKMGFWRSKMYKTPWNAAKPRTTPDGLAQPQKAVKMLNAVATYLKKKHGKLTIAWGKMHRLKYGKYNLPANGSAGGIGVFRVAWEGYTDKQGINYVGGGDSWVGVIEFGKTVKAKVLLSYGNSTQKTSKHYGDQLPLFSKKKLRNAWFYPQDVFKHKVREEVFD
ncbi:acylase [uncultured Microscilla sp.]|uniref:acylase n=1 Tax=uncultured Microscilla sp. TaxID=432653 RepID=UPI002624E17E|nr:acylase [uncultured Microscilla sp.]